MSSGKEKEPTSYLRMSLEWEIIELQRRLTGKESYHSQRLTDSASKKQVSRVLETTMFTK